MTPSRDDPLAMDPPPTTPPVHTMLVRGAVAHCPVCGSGHLFRRGVVMVERCPRCGLVFERVEGHWVGAIGVNTIISFVALFFTVVFSFVVLSPERPVVPLLVAPLVVGLLVPPVTYPLSKTLWTAIDLAMRPLAAGEADPDAPR
ncbi:MAG: DUF983 domain-containing protein [Acidimicrobiales bacterium]